MKRYWEYFKYVFWHKYYVAVECFKVGLYWRGIKHDISKFYPSEFIPYAKHFYNKDGSKRDLRDSTGYYDPLKQSDEFTLAWLHHAHHNDHHWQYWCLATKEDTKQALIHNKDNLERIPMTREAVEEMICDWKGAAKAQGNNDPEAYLTWYEANKHKLIFSSPTLVLLDYRMPRRIFTRK